MSDESLLITIPAALVPTGGSPVLKLQIITDKAGKRQITRQLRDANASDAGRIRRVPYMVWGPIGASFESDAGMLGVDWVRGLDTRWPSRLLPNGRENPVTLTGFDPPAATSGYFGGFNFGMNTFGNLTAPFVPTIGGEDVVVFDEQQGYLFAERGVVSTQISYDTWTAIQSIIQDAPILDSALWRGNVYLAEGSNVPMQRRVSAGSGGSTYQNTVSTTPVGNVYASAIKRGSDRAWYIDASQGTNSLIGEVAFNFASFTLDRFLNLAAPFQVGDPEIGTTGIAPFGPFTMFGAQDNIYSFTDQGKPVPFSRALLGFQSPQNGKQGADPGWGWNYIITAIGLRAMQPGVDNPVGIGESMRGFTGHTGVPTAVWANRGELWVVYNDDGDIYGYRGGFGPRTAATGQPLMFPWFYASSETCGAIFSSSTPAEPVIIRAAGTNLVYTIIAANGRDDIDPDYVYSSQGGTGWFTTLDRDPQLLKTFRLARIRTRSMGYSSSWALSCAFDSIPQNPVGSTYTAIGTVTTDGFSTLLATNGGADSQGNPTPTANISGRTIKPRLVLTAKLIYFNYITNPSFETGTTGWSNGPGTATIAQTSAQALYGTYSGLISGMADQPIASTTFTLTASTTFMCSVGVYVATATKPTSISVDITGLAGATGDLTSPVDMTKLDQWQTVTVGPFTTGSDVTGTLTFNGVAGTILKTFYVDGIMIVNAGALTNPTVPYIDGNQGVGYIWLGTANGSISEWSPGNTDPPEVDALELEYVERPQQIEEVGVLVSLESLGAAQDNYLWDTLRQLVGDTTDGPFRVQFPDDQPPAVTGASGGGQVYAMLNSVTKREDVSGEIEGVLLSFSTWPEAEALSR